jgi:pimeloyl-ACP methyl ester carboxylesterase
VIATYNGTGIHLQELGEGGPPLVMLHGLFVGSLAMWYFTAAPELAKTHRVALYDLRGHGRSERAKSGYDVETMRADLEAITRRFEGEKVTLVGHSYGGVVALSFALAYPERVAKVAVVEAPLPPSRLEELESFLGKSPDQMTESLPEALRDALGRKGRQAAKLVDSLRFLATECSLLADLRRAKDFDDAELARLARPLLAVYGVHSSCRPVGRRLARVVPGAKLVEVDGGHFLPVEAPAAVTSAVAEFVRG